MAMVWADEIDLRQRLNDSSIEKNGFHAISIRGISLDSGLEFEFELYFFDHLVMIS